LAFWQRSNIWSRKGAVHIMSISPKEPKKCGDMTQNVGFLRIGVPSGEAQKSQIYQ